MDWFMFWDDPEFWPAFWPSFCAEFIVGVLIAIVLVTVISKVRAPKPDGRILVERTDLPNGDQRFEFRVQNTGDLAFRGEEVRWELFIPYDLMRSYNFHFTNPANTTVEVDEQTLSRGIEYSAYHGLLKVPLFQGVTVKLFEWKVPNSEPPLKGHMYYVLSTPHGQLPQKAKRTKNGRVDIATAAVVEPYSIHGTVNVTLDVVDTLSARGEVRDPVPAPDQ